MDYRKILIAYIDHVGRCEGVDFLGSGPSEVLPGLTEEEGIALAKARDASLVEEGRGATGRMTELPTSMWIACSDRLPAPNRLVPVSDDDNDWFPAQYSEREARWCDAWFDYIPDEDQPTHWFDIPLK